MKEERGKRRDEGEKGATRKKGEDK